MAPVNRNEPKRSKSSESRYTVMQFMADFPDDSTCLDWLWRQRFAPDGHTALCPKCERERRFHRVKARASYSCDSCGHHLHPTAGTIFHKSSTSLQLWFYAMYLMTSTRCAVSAKHLERELGVTYKTAWRMANLIRNQLMKQDDFQPLTGEVEVDETWIGGRPKAGRRLTHAQAGGYADKHKTMVVAMVERGGRVRAEVAPNSRRETLSRVVDSHVDRDAELFTDEWAAYRMVGQRFAGHHRVAHKSRENVRGRALTNTVEGFFGNVKRGISGNYHSISKKWTQGYLNEFVWRYNHRDDAMPMFGTLLLRAAS